MGTRDGVCGRGNRSLLTAGVSAVVVCVHACVRVRVHVCVCVRVCVCVCVCVLTAGVSAVPWVAVTFWGQLLALNMPQSWGSGKSRRKTLMFAAKAPGWRSLLFGATGSPCCLPGEGWCPARCWRSLDAEEMEAQSRQMTGSSHTAFLGHRHRQS